MNHGSEMTLLPPAEHIEAPAHLIHDDTGTQRAYVWKGEHWRSHEWANPVSPRDACYRGWRYIAPLYPLEGFSHG